MQDAPQAGYMIAVYVNLQLLQAGKPVKYQGDAREKLFGITEV